MQQLLRRPGDHGPVVGPVILSMRIFIIVLMCAFSVHPASASAPPRDESPKPPAACTPDCDGLDCGDDGCGGSCGACPDGWACRAGFCVCAPKCDGRKCGDDGCGGSCGTCPAEHRCTRDGVCECIPDCAGRACGDDGCGGSCGICPGPQDLCTDGRCVCQPSCSTTRICGADGCGGSCGMCPADEMCRQGRCVCRPQCEGRACGPDSCGGSCGACPGGRTCVDAACWEPQCSEGMCFVPEGGFLQGCSGQDTASCAAPERPQRTVVLPAFLIDQSEVTVRAYRGCVIADRCTRPSKSGAYCNYGKRDLFDHPCNCVT